MKIRNTQPDDLTLLGRIADQTGLFPGNMLPDLARAALTGAAPDIWLTCEDDRQPIGFCFAAPETLADGTWNMLAIAVLPERQGGGVGQALTADLESRLRNTGQRVLIADTSGTDAFAATRAFYVRAGYVEEARIRDFWALGDDKIVFWKSLL